MGSPHHRLLPAIFDERGRSNPRGEWAKFPVSETTYEAGFRVATNRDAANAINRMAWLLEEKLGRSQTFETITYIGPTDLRYYIVLLAAIKVGYKTFLPSPRNSTVAHIDLLTKLNCKNLVTTNPGHPCIPSILEAYPMRQTCIPSLVELLDSEGVPEYPFEKTYLEARDEPIFVLHTSGSTGIPKPLVYTHEFATRVANVFDLEAPDGHVNMMNRARTGRFLAYVPAFHMAGIGFCLLVAPFNKCIPVLPLPGKPPTTEGFVEALKYADVDWAFVLPVIIDELSRDPAALDLVASKIQYLYYTGGSLPQAAGEAVTSKVHIHQCLGSSENAGFPLVQPVGHHTRDDWSYLQFHPAGNMQFRHRLEDLHELVIVKDEKFEMNQPVFTHFPHLAEFETQDLFSPHPTMPDRWRHRGRRDDIIVFINGEKTNPISFEQDIGRHPEVRSALVAGDQRFEACLLVELNNPGPHTPEEQTQIVERIWPVVKAANSQCPAHARISKARILLAKPDMPMLRAGKGTVQRQSTLSLYAELIDDLYTRADQHLSVMTAASLDFSDPVAVIEAVNRLVLDITDWAEINNGDDFFARGMDSLQVLQISRGLKSALGLTSAAPSVIYDNPSVNMLADATLRFHDKGTISNGNDNDHVEAMASMLGKYESDIDKLAEAPPNLEADRTPSESEVVILTGSTGTVGSHILHELLQNNRVSHIYCLNRGKDSQAIQESRNSARGLPVDFSAKQVTFLTVDLTKSDFGLESTVWEAMLSTVTQIIHNAWPVDFNQRLLSFQPSLDGVLSLISFAANAKLAPSLFFLSSISAVTDYHRVPDAKHHVPETVITSLECPARMGYGESKYLAERILNHATTKLGIKTGVARIGQVAGTAHNPRGWNRNEWFPSLVISSRALRALPLSLGAFEDTSRPGGVMDSVDWVPVDQLAAVLSELSSNLSAQPASTSIRVFHPVNPHPRDWESLAPVVARVLQTNLAATGNGNGAEIQLVGYQRWLELLRSAAENLENGSKEHLLSDIPATKLLEFFEGTLLVKGSDQVPRPLSMELALEASPSLRSLEAIHDEWLSGWVHGWTS